MASLTWDKLKSGIEAAFSSDRVDVDEVQRLMSSYHSDQEDWGSFARFDPHRYTRNLVDEGNDHYNLIVLCWGEGHGSSIHDHADSHCFMKVLSGSLKETLFAWPSDSQGQGTPLKAVRSTTLVTDEVTYINNTLGLHRIENPSHVDPAVSLHLYCPPITLCQSFEERTGKAHACKVTFYSRGGNVVNCS